MSEAVDSRQIALVIVREGEPLGGVVRAWVDAEFDGTRRLEQHSDELVLRNAIIAAVDAWAVASREGQAALADSSFDFNLGDLICAVSAEFGRIESRMIYDERDLEHHLRAQGVRALTIETIAIADHWVYDTQLFSPISEQLVRGS